MTAINLEVHGGDHDLLDYCTFRMEAPNDARRTVRENSLLKDHSQNIKLIIIIITTTIFIVLSS